MAAEMVYRVKLIRAEADLKMRQASYYSLLGTLQDVRDELAESKADNATHEIEMSDESDVS